MNVNSRALTWSAALGFLTLSPSDYPWLLDFSFLQKDSAGMTLPP